MFWRIIIIVNVEDSHVLYFCYNSTSKGAHTGTLIIYILSKFTVSEKQDYTKLRRQFFPCSNSPVSTLLTITRRQLTSIRDRYTNVITGWINEWSCYYRYL